MSTEEPNEIIKKKISSSQSTKKKIKNRISKKRR